MGTDLATGRRVWTVTAVSFAIFAACAILLPGIGSVPVSYARAWQGIEPDHQILMRLRYPRVGLALIAGGALGVSGVLFQALLRDALATPYTLGISAGASLGAVIAIAAGWSAVAVSSSIGAILTLLLVLGVASNRRILSPFTLLMAGVTVNSICMACILFIHSITTFGESIAITRWLMGGVDAPEPSTLIALTAFVLIALVYCFANARNWNVLAVGQEWASVRGVETGRLMIGGYIAGSLLTGALTSLTGPIGFVGLIVPHALRMSLGADHRVLVPASFFLGGAFLSICDAFARTAMSPAEIPVGVITAMLGGPFFIWLLRSR